MAKIQEYWPKFKQNGPNLARKPQFWPEVHYFGPLDLYCGLWYLDSDQIWAILLEFGPLCLDLGQFAYIWAILLEFGLFGRMEGRMDVWTDRSPCVLQDLVPFGAAAPLLLNLDHTLFKQGMGTADHLLRLGCFNLLCRNNCMKDWQGSLSISFAYCSSIVT